MRRASSHNTNMLQKKGSEKKRGKENKPGPNDPPQIKEGDIYYRTIRNYPSHPELPEEFQITITRPDAPSGISEPRKSIPFNPEVRAPSVEGRRGSVISDKGIREEATTPGGGENGYGYERDR